VTVLVGKERAIEAICLEFCKTLDMVPHSILVSKLVRWMDYLMGEELIGWLNLEGSGPLFNVQREVSNNWCPLGVYTGSGTAQYLY